MKKQVWILCAAILVICLLLLLLRSAQYKNVIAPEQSVTLTNRANQSKQTQIEENRQTSNDARMLTLPPSATPLAKTIATTNPLVAKELALWQAPIEFYGKVVDENGNPVVGAKVTFKWTEIPVESGNRTATTESDEEGLFSLHSQRGPDLIVSVSKEGYYTSRLTPNGFHYALANEIFHPNPQNPAVFYLRKKGVGENLIKVKQNYRVARDGTPLGIDLATGKANTAGSGNLVVQCWTDDQGKQSGQKYDWRCVVGIPGGGIITNNEEFAFEAPEEGYSPSLKIAMPADLPNWTSDVDLKLYYRLADGRYGRMTFSMIAGGDHFCMIDSVLNPTGSRNLEPAQ